MAERHFVEQVAQAVAGARHDQRQGDGIGITHGVRARPPIADGHARGREQAQFFRKHWRQCKSARLAGAVEDGHVDLAFAQPVEDEAAHRLGDPQPDLRVAPRSLVDQPRGEHLAHRSRQAEADLAGEFHLRAADDVEELLEGFDHQSAMFEKPLAGLGQLHAARGPEEERDLQVLLDVAHVLAQRRLRDVQPLGRLRQRTFLGDGDEIAQVPHVHAGTI